MLEKYAVSDIPKDIQEPFLIVFREIFFDRLDVKLAFAPDAVQVLYVFDETIKIYLGSDQVNKLLVRDAIDGNVDLIDACVD